MYARLDVADWRRRTAALYEAVRRPSEPIEVRHARFWEGRDALFRGHPATPLEPEDQPGFSGVPRYPYDPALRYLVAPQPIEDGDPLHLRLRDDGEVRLAPVARLEFAVVGQPSELVLYAFEAYGGGLFLPFRDATSGAETYGGGRYLLDTIKHADLGVEEGPRSEHRLVLDFNFAYHPSCVYSPAWDCPLAPTSNHLSVAIRAGERLA